MTYSANNASNENFIHFYEPEFRIGQVLISRVLQCS